MNLKTHPLVFMGTPEFAVPSLNFLIESKVFDVRAIVTQPDKKAHRGQKWQPSPIKKVALQHNLTVLTPKSINDNAILDTLKGYEADIAVVVAFGQLLKRPILESFPKGCVNLHASLLPRWRGAAPIQRALMNGDTKTGITLQKMVLALDEGPLLGERILSLSPDSSATDVHNKLAFLCQNLLEKELVSYLNGSLTPVAQEEIEVTYARKISKEEARINWNNTCCSIHNQVRGLSMGPTAYTIFNGKRVQILKTRTIKVSQPPLQPGQTFMERSRLWIGCRDGGAIELVTVKPEGSKAMDAKNFITGYPIPEFVEGNTC